MSHASDLLGRARHNVANRVAQFRPLASVRLGNELAAPTKGWLESEDFLLSRPHIGQLPLVALRTHSGRLFPHVRAIELLLEAPRTFEAIRWKSPRIGAIPMADVEFITSRIKRVPLELPEPAAENLFIPLTKQESAECLELVGKVLLISENLFKPLGRTRAGGKAYKQKTVRQDTFLAEPQEEPQSETGYRKSYQERRSADGSRSRQPMSIWDLLFPLLLPPPFDLTSGQAVFLPAELQAHQPEGVKFLASNAAALLGDGVQTGKTIQAIVAMKLLFQSALVRSALVICPIPVLMHWQRQMEKWAPELWQGLTVVRSPNKAQRQIKWRMPAHVYITNYETIVSDFEDIRNTHGQKPFELIVCDEVQRIKNHGTTISQRVKEMGMQARYCWGLSATPIENSLGDLVSIFEFLKPGLLTRGYEGEVYAKMKIKPHFLRRRTEDIVKNFTAPRYDTYPVELEGKQLEEYEKAFSDSVAELRKLGETVSLPHVLGKLQALKQLCNAFHPQQEDAESAKLEWLRDWLANITATGSKVLVFSQYREFGLDFLERKLKDFGCLHYGHAKNDAQRNSIVDAFSKEPQKYVFLANPATAGTGLPDLKVANYVVHFDHWWNPAREDQANGRILGIGQKKEAFIAHVWVENSIEGKIQEILARKRQLFGRVIDAQSSVGDTGLSTEDVFGLFGLQVPDRLRENAERQPSKPDPGISELDQVSPIGFEWLVVRLYQAMGYAARATPATRDGGIDAIALRDLTPGREKLAIQCKHQKAPVGRPELQKLLGTIAAEPSFSAGVLVTSSTFSADARMFAAQNGRLQLVDRHTLMSLLCRYKIKLTETDEDK
jgi:superfamily II DNA or RNA helicase